jgi:hypothetical protein
MRVKAVVFISLALNAAMGVALVALYRSLSEVPPAPVAETPWSFASNSPLRVAKTNIIVRPRTLTWRELESTNYEVYIENLRFIGCPDSTVHDIIVADINQIYARKRRELNTTTNDMQWWRSYPDPTEARAALAASQALEDERVQLLRRLLGPGAEQSGDNNVEPVPLTGPVLSSLTPEQKQTVQDIVARARLAMRQYAQERELTGEPADPVELAQLREATRRELEAQLNPEQLQEFLLRYSDNAERLRQELRGFNSTPEEFRRLFSATDAIDRELQYLRNDDDPLAVAERTQLEQQRLAVIQQMLTPERYETYRILTDSDYRAAMSDAQLAGAPPEAGRRVYAINQAAAQEKERIENDGRLTPQERSDELSLLDQQQQAARAEALGLEPPPSTRPSAAQANMFQHQAGPNDTLPALALYYRVPLEDLIRENPSLATGVIPPGQTVRIPHPAPLPWMPGIVPSK